MKRGRIGPLPANASPKTERMGGAAGKHAKELAQVVGDDEFFSPMVLEKKHEDQGPGMSAHQSVRFKF